MHHVKAIALDFDNCVILDTHTGTGSEEIKDRGWFEVFKEYDAAELGPVLEKAKNDIAGGKGDRADVAYAIMRHFGVPEAGARTQIDSRCAAFDSYVQNGIQTIGVSDEVRAALAEFSKHTPTYINTATPQISARQSAERLHIAHYFKNILGRPGTKVENLRAIISQEDIEPRELLFVDDQQSGWQAAQETDARFIGIITKRNTAWHHDTPFETIRSLTELPSLLAQ